VAVAAPPRQWDRSMLVVRGQTLTAALARELAKLAKDVGLVDDRPIGMPRVAPTHVTARTDRGAVVRSRGGDADPPAYAAAVSGLRVCAVATEAEILLPPPVASHGSPLLADGAAAGVRGDGHDGPIVAERTSVSTIHAAPDEVADRPNMGPRPRETESGEALVGILPATCNEPPLMPDNAS
jgi:hypothetical protein